MHPPLKVVVFGYRGVLLDNVGPEHNAVKDVFRLCRSGRPPGLDQYRKGRGVDFAEFCYSHGISRDIGPERLRELKKEALLIRGKGIEFYAGARQVLSTCINLKLKTVIVSKALERVIEGRLFQFNITQEVSFIRGGVSNVTEALLSIISTEMVEPGEVLFVEDTRDRLVAGKEVGVRTLGITHGHNDRETIMRARPEFPNRKFPRTESLWQVRRIICHIAGAAR